MSNLVNVQILEVVRLEGQPLTHDEVLLSRDIDMLQVGIWTPLVMLYVCLVCPTLFEEDVF